jgi:hypothetical protein
LFSATKEDFKGLLLECWDEGKKRRFLGQVDFPPQILIDGRDITTWFSLGKKPTDKSKQADVKGDIYLSMLFTEGGVLEEAPPAEDKKKKPDMKNTGAIDTILSDLKSSPLEGLKALAAYITTTSIYSEGDTEILDPEFASNALSKNVVDAVLQVVNTNDHPDTIAYCCFVFGKLAELDSGESPFPPLLCPFVFTSNSLFILQKLLLFWLLRVLLVLVLGNSRRLTVSTLQRVLLFSTLQRVLTQSRSCSMKMLSLCC